MTLGLRNAAALLALAAIMTLVSVTARPAIAAPPGPCNGMFATDPDGDGEFYANGTLGILISDPEPAPANLEVLGAFMNGPTVNIVIKNLDKTLPSGTFGGSGGNWYYAYYTHGDATRFVRAANRDGETITYAFGEVTSEGFYLTDGDTTGSFEEGPNGVVSILIPETVGGKPGEVLGGLFMTSETIEGRDDFIGINHQSDWTGVPDGDADIITPNGTDHTVKACPAGPPAVGGTGGGSTGGGSTGGGGGTGGGSGQPPAQPTANRGAQPTTLRWRPTSFSLGSAKKAGKRKKLRLKSIAEDEIKNLVVKLKKGSKTMGAGKSSTFAAGKQKTISMSVSKKLKKGKYKLIATGFVGGKKLSVTLDVTFS